MPSWQRIWGSSRGFYFYRRPASPAWVIKSTRLHTGKQIASFKHENWLSQRVPHETEHLSSSVYSTHKITFPTCFHSEWLKHLEALTCYFSFRDKGYLSICASISFEALQSWVYLKKKKNTICMLRLVLIGLQPQMQNKLPPCKEETV